MVKNDYTQQSNKKLRKLNNMSIPILICDDSLVSRKTIQKSLPKGWDVNITLAKNGVEGLEKIRQGLGEVVFLDLTMPEMDGFQLLEIIKKEQLKSFVIVISADIQPEARARVLNLGAIDFIKKPIDAKTLAASLKNFGLLWLAYLALPKINATAYKKSST